MAQRPLSAGFTDFRDLAAGHAQPPIRLDSKHAVRRLSQPAIGALRALFGRRHHVVILLCASSTRSCNSSGVSPTGLSVSSRPAHKSPLRPAPNFAVHASRKAGDSWRNWGLALLSGRRVPVIVSLQGVLPGASGRRVVADLPSRIGSPRSFGHRDGRSGGRADECVEVGGGVGIGQLVQAG